MLAQISDRDTSEILTYFRLSPPPPPPLVPQFKVSVIVIWLGKYGMY